MVAVCFLRSTLYYYAEPRSAIYPGNIESVFTCFSAICSDKKLIPISVFETFTLHGS